MNTHRDSIYIYELCNKIKNGSYLITEEDISEEDMLNIITLLKDGMYSQIVMVLATEEDIKNLPKDNYTVNNSNSKEVWHKNNVLTFKCLLGNKLLYCLYKYCVLTYPKENDIDRNRVSNTNIRFITITSELKNKDLTLIKKLV